MGPMHCFEGGMWVIPLVMIVICFVLFKSGVLGRMGPHGRNPETNSEESALEILKKRYAKGEITKEEFQSTLWRQPSPEDSLGLQDQGILWEKWRIA